MSQLLDPSVDPSLAGRARDALRRHAWGEAWEILSEADRAGTLTPDELLVLADAAWWVGKLPVAIDALERAYAAALKNDRPEQAAMAAILLGRDHVIRNQHAVATAWLRRADRLLERFPESPLHGWLAVSRAFQAGLTGPVETTLAQAALAEAVADRFGDRDLAAMAMACRGVGLVMSGQPDEGIALLDEAAVAAVGGELEPDTAGSVCCAAIGACASLGDWSRAMQWTEAQDRWCEREGINGYPGMCRLYRSEIKSLRGAWLEAEAEARRAAEELRDFVPAAVGMALYQIGELRLRRGDLPAAEEALLAAHAVGRAEPALSLLRLAQGRPDAAFESIREALDGSDLPPSWHATPNSLIHRASLLPAYVEIALAAGDRDAATAGATELATLAQQFGSAAMRARAAAADAAVRLDAGDTKGALAAARRAVAAWRDVDAPWEAARARVLLAEVQAAEGSTESAVLELRSARVAFEELEAVPDVRRVDGLLRGLGAIDAGPATAPTSQRAIRTFVFTDIVDSTRLAEQAGDEAWSASLRWHDRTVRAAIGQHGGEEIKRTGDGFFVAFDDADRALEFAIAVQRAFAEPPAPGLQPVRVRIGSHRAEATRSGMDYVGTGVNVAARITTAAEGDEILVSHATLDWTRRSWQVDGRRSIELRGVSQPVDVTSITWRATSGREDGSVGAAAE